MSNLRINAPLTKFEAQPDGSLLIEGIITREAIDHAGDVIPFGSAGKSLAKWRGNLREMHQPIAAGRKIDLQPVDGGGAYLLKAFVSAGAKDTQAKVIDGTLSEFSVGGLRGPETKATVTADLCKAMPGIGIENIGKRVTILYEPVINEISLVDAGAGVECSFSLVKAVGVEEEKPPAEGDVPPVVEAAAPGDGEAVTKLLEMFAGMDSAERYAAIDKLIQADGILESFTDEQRVAIAGKVSPKKEEPKPEGEKPPAEELEKAIASEWTKRASEGETRLAKIDGEIDSANGLIKGLGEQLSDLAKKNEALAAANEALAKRLDVYDARPAPGGPIQNRNASSKDLAKALDSAKKATGNRAASPIETREAALKAYREQ